MSSLKEIAKNGWHPGNSGSGGFKDKWRDDFKGLNQVAGWMGKGKDNDKSHDIHRSPRPLQSLKDPVIFGPPPKRIISQTSDISLGLTLPNRDSSSCDISKTDERDKKHLPPPVPYRTTGKKPTSPHQSSYTCSDQAKHVNGEASLSIKEKPSLPPRLPPRNKSNLKPSLTKKSEPNLQERFSEVRLSNLTSTAQNPNRKFDSFSSLMGTPKQTSNEDLNRHPRTLPSLPPTSTNSSSGTSFAEKKTALKTISSLRNNPSSVSISDVKEAAYTTNNFRERHGEQVKSGWQLADKLNQQHGIARKIGSVKPYSEEDNKTYANSRNGDLFKDNLVKKRPPPPPPPLRNDLVSSKLSSKSQPPLIPISTKPKWNPQ